MKSKPALQISCSHMAPAVEAEEMPAGKYVLGRIIGRSSVRAYATLAPLLALYTLVVLMTSSEALLGDEPRYIAFANNLAHGFYSPADKIDLWNGPGYPLVLLPFVWLRLPWLAAKLLNAVFLFGAVIYFYHTLRFYLPERTARYCSFLIGLYPPLMKEANVLVTESLTFFLIGGFSFHFWQFHRDDRNRWRSLLAASGFLGYLALTKVFFGYVIVAMLLPIVVLYLWRRMVTWGKTSSVYALALVFCLPYLVYTYSLTGKVFYWGNSGGQSLYWMSSPFDGELGDWHHEQALDDNPQLRKNHGGFFAAISGLDSVQKDDELKREAMRNITRYPARFLRNWVANVGRLLFSYPFSYTPQKLSTFFYLVPNMFVVVLSVLCVYSSWRGRRLVPHEIQALLLFAIVALGGSSLLSAYDRQFRVLVPIFGLWIVFTLTRILTIRLRDP